MVTFKIGRSEHIVSRTCLCPTPECLDLLASSSTWLQIPADAEMAKSLGPLPPPCQTWVDPLAFWLWPFSVPATGRSWATHKWMACEHYVSKQTNQPVHFIFQADSSYWTQWAFFRNSTSKTKGNSSVRAHEKPSALTAHQALLWSVLNVYPRKLLSPYSGSPNYSSSKSILLVCAKRSGIQHYEYSRIFFE